MLDWLADFHFLRPLWLFGIVPFLGLWWALSQASRVPPSWRRAIAPELLPHLVTGQQNVRRFRPSSLVVPVGVLGCVAMAGPTWELADSPLEPDRSAMVIAFELSDTMDGRDVGPTRAKRAAFKLRDLIETRGAGQTGLIVYAGTAHTVMPLTDDDRVILPYLDALSPELLPVPGDRPQESVPLLERLIESASAPTTVVLVTDGVPPEGVEAISSLQERTGAELVIYAVGTDRGDAPRDIPALEQTSLEQLASSTNGSIVPLSIGDGDLRRILRVLDRHRRAAVDPGDESAWEDEGYYLVFPLALLVLFWFRKGWVLRLPAGTALLVLGLAGCEGGSHRFADLWLTPDQQGRVLFERGDFGEAAKRFEDPMWKGIASYAAEDWPKAVEAWSTVESPESLYNLGNAYAQQNQWITAIQQYDKALTLHPTFREARANRDLLQGLLDKMQESVDPEEAAKGPPPDSKEDAVRLREDQEAPDELKPQDGPSPTEEAGKPTEPLTEETLEIWMRRVDTRPANFLAGKFAAQAGAEGR